MKGFWRFAKIFAATFLIISIVLSFVLVGVLFGLEDNSMDILVKDYKPDFSSSIYYKTADGSKQKLLDLYDKENREWVELKDIAQSVKDAVVAIEDERFYEHKGVDLKRTGGAFLGFLTGNTSYGGSTLTQQLIKNITNDKDASPIRKVREIVRAINLERKMSKNDILEMYLNTFFLANGCYGIKTASEFYFNKEPSELSLAEAAALVGITQYPVRYDPLINPKNNKSKQELVLKKMFELGYIKTEGEYKKAVAQKLKFIGKQSNVSGKSNQSYFVDEVIREVVADLCTKRGYTEKMATRLVYTGGLQIYATIDTSVQKAMETVFENQANFPSIKGDVKPEAAMTIIDPYTGQIKGLIGGRGIKQGDRVWNRATMSLRQPGSTIKPLSVYGPAIESNLITAATIVEDAPIDIKGWTPKNYYSGFKGYVTVRHAVEISMNTPAVRILQQLGVNNSFNFLKNNLGMTSLVESRKVGTGIVTDKTYSSMSLGGLTDGVSSDKLAAAYAPFVNGGTYYRPTTYTKVTDGDGKLILENNIASKLAMSKETAYIVSQLLKSVVNNGTGAAARLNKTMEVGGKTGTTDDDIDRWFVGITPYYVGTVWFGYDQPKTMSFLSANPTIPLWKKVMDLVHKPLESKTFTQPKGIDAIRVCSVSGNLAVEGCSSYTEYFKTGTAPKKYCKVHAASITPEPLAEPTGEASESNVWHEGEPAKTDDGANAQKSAETNQGEVAQKPDTQSKPSAVEATPAA